MKSAIKTLQTNHLDYFQSELKKSNKLEIISPFITEDVTQFILTYLSGENVRLLTRYNLRDFYSGVSNLDAIKLFYKSGTEIRGVYRLHSKLYIFDDRTAIITSANFTKGGMLSNMEFGLMVTNEKVVKDCKRYFDELWNKADNKLTSETIKVWEAKIKKALKLKVKTNDESGLNDEGKDCFGDNESKAELTSVRKFTGYKKSKSSVSFSKRYFIKYIGATNVRKPLSEKISDEIINSECDNRIFYSYHPHQISDGDVVYFGRMTEDPADYAIIGRGIGVKHIPSRDVVKPTEKRIKKWKKKYKYYNQVHSCEFIDGRLEDCVLLTRDIISKFNYRTLLTTLNRWNNGERDIVVSRSLMQKQFVEITPEVAKWLDKKLAKQFSIKGILAK